MSTTLPSPSFDDTIAALLANCFSPMSQPLCGPRGPEWPRPRSFAARRCPGASTSHPATGSAWSTGRRIRGARALLRAVDRDGRVEQCREARACGLGQHAGHVVVKQRRPNSHRHFCARATLSECGRSGEPGRDGHAGRLDLSELPAHGAGAGRRLLLRYGSRDSRSFQGQGVGRPTRGPVVVRNWAGAGSSGRRRAGFSRLRRPSRTGADSDGRRSSRAQRAGAGAHSADAPPSWAAVERSRPARPDPRSDIDPHRGTRADRGAESRAHARANPR